MRYLGNKIFFFIFIGFLSLIIAYPAGAVTVTITQYPSTITRDPFTITASISGAVSGTNYVRIDLYKEGSTNYFGETYNNTDWYSGSEYTQYLAVPIGNGQWSGTLQGSIGSPSTSEYDGTGTYRMRLRRYTGGGTTNATEADNSSVVVHIALPIPTPMPTNTPAPTATVIPSATPRPTASPTPKLKLPPTNSQILSAVATAADATDDADILAAEENISPTSVQKEKGPQATIIPGIFFGIGGVLLIGCGILFIYKYKKEDADNTNV